MPRRAVSFSAAELSLRLADESEEELEQSTPEDKTMQCTCFSYADDTLLICMSAARERTLLRKLGFSFFIFGLINNGNYINLFLSRSAYI